MLYLFMTSPFIFTVSIVGAVVALIKVVLMSSGSRRINFVKAIEEEAVINRSEVIEIQTESIEEEDCPWQPALA